ncbi:MAG: type II toxin-antitoxin system HicB family antitoxin [Chloroflexi bacterium]|nr:MAG: type II toxin-antitoxin system HicB family antitoxin [Chloroflexota bacterium]
MKFAIVLTPGEDGFIVAECPTLPGCVTQGKAEDEALRNAREAIAGWLEAEADKVRKEAEAPVVLVDV